VEVPIFVILVGLIEAEVHQMTVVDHLMHVLVLQNVLLIHALVLLVLDLQTQEIRVVLTVVLTLVHGVIVQGDLLHTFLDLKKDLVEPHLSGTKLHHPLHLPPVFLHHQPPPHNLTPSPVTLLLKIKKR
jgi:hypothetical protein